VTSLDAFKSPVSSYEYAARLCANSRTEQTQTQATGDGRRACSTSIPTCPDSWTDAEIPTISASQPCRVCRRREYYMHPSRSPHGLTLTYFCYGGVLAMLSVH